MKSRAYIIIGVSALLLFASCGQQHKAESLVSNFVAENIEDPSAISGKDFAELGTTRHLSDSLIKVMRQRGAANFKKGISYGKIPSGDLYYLRMSYISNGDTLQNTFYLDSDLSEVVAFK
jgi:hypothetical protein